MLPFLFNSLNFYLCSIVGFLTPFKIEALEKYIKYNLLSFAETLGLSQPFTYLLSNAASYKIHIILEKRIYVKEKQNSVDKTCKLLGFCFLRHQYSAHLLSFLLPFFFFLPLLKSAVFTDEELSELC